MGIRFYCPNGHKLNVKAFLAGKRGVCPKCGAKVLIPLHSTRSSRKSSANEPPLDPSHEGTSPPVPPPLKAAGRAEALGAPEPHLASEPAQDSADEFDALIFEELDFSALEAPPSPKSSTPPPQTSGRAGRSAEQSWYVRLPSGNQFGPATSDLIRSWIQEGRVPHDSLVWREGWRDWREASTAFPQLSAEGADSSFEFPAPRPQAPPPATGAARNRGKTADLSPVVLWILLVTVTALLILSGALIWIFLEM